MSLEVQLNNEPCPHCGQVKPGFSKNITHNLVPMAKAVGCYIAVWRPEEYNLKTGEQLILHLQKAVEFMNRTFDYLKQHEHPSGWGTRKDLLEFLEAYLAACKENPTATIWVHR